MNEQVMDPLARMKPQRGRNADTPAPVIYAPALSGRNGGMRWRLVAYATAYAVAAVCATAAALLA